LPAQVPSILPIKGALLKLRLLRAACMLAFCTIPGVTFAAPGGQGGQAQNGIYTCVDAQGRRITADRPIAACSDREQRELNPSGTVRRLLAPALTERERAVEEDSARRQAVERARVQEQMRRERALLVRYPDQQTFDNDRRAALRQSDDSVAFARQRIGELEQRHAEIKKSTFEFTSRSVAVPQGLQQDASENQQALSFQQNIVAEQQRDRQRIIQRYDTEQRHLRELWAAEAAAAPASTSSSR
jgi:hypothetical protein